MKQFWLTIRTDIGSLPRPVYILVFGQFINRLGAFVYPFLSLYLTEKGYALVLVSGVLAAIAGGNLLGPIVGGYLSDAIGRRNTIVLSLAGSSVSLISVYYSDGYVTLLVTAAIYGFSSFLFGPPSNALIADLVTADSRITAYTLMRLAINLGFAVGPMVAGVLYMTSPMLIFVGDAATTMVFAVLAFCMLPHGLRTVKGKVSSPKVVLKSWGDALSSVNRNYEYKQFLLAIFLMGIAFCQIFSLLALTTREAGISPKVYGIVMGFNGLLIVLVEIPLIQYIKRFESRKVLAIGYVLVGIGCALFGVVDSMMGFFLAMFVFTIGEIVALPIGMAYSSNLAPEKFRGRYFGLRGMTWALSNLAGSLGLWGYGVFGPTWWLMAGIFAVVAAVAISSRQAEGVCSV
ncbi:MFS transporter [Puniceicoccaceae bacterium K14]|nr:MFS transporter [Puniceicoccaceae bacterium K14]